MFRIRTLAGIAVFCVASVACVDTPTSLPSPEPEVVEELESIPGILVASNVLRSGNRIIHLVGWQTTLLSGLVGAEVLVDGPIDPSDGALIIREFVVLTVDGLRAVDGLL